jgi:hypothetical protein
MEGGRGRVPPGRKMAQASPLSWQINSQGFLWVVAPTSNAKPCHISGDQQPPRIIMSRAWHTRSHRSSDLEQRRQAALAPRPTTVISRRPHGQVEDQHPPAACRQASAASPPEVAVSVSGVNREARHDGNLTATFLSRRRRYMRSPLVAAGR